MDPLSSLDEHTLPRADERSGHNAKLDASAYNQRPVQPLDHHKDTAQGSSAAMAASPRLSSDELEMDILQGIFAGWDPEYDIHSACSSSSISVSMSPHESLSIESLTKCATASRAVETLTKRRSSSTDKTKPKLASSSARQKHEKHRLQREAHELSEKLRRLQESARVSWLKRDDELPTSSKLVVSPAWKTVAKTHRDQLQQAQSGNQQLKLQSLEHKKLAKNLRRALCKRMTQNEVR